MHLLERSVLPVMAVGLSVILALPAQAASPEPTQAEVEAVVERIKQDPNLNATERSWQPEFKPRTSTKPRDDKPSRREREPPSWVAEVARLMMWGLGALLIGVVLWGLRGWVRAGGLVREARLQNLPSHVRDLDIRPDSLPPLVGRTAWGLWQRGDQRGALSLLYRAMLSRLVHVHAVPILSASTEGECVTLARQHLGTSPLRLVEQLVHAWQMTVYGGRSPTDAVIQDLCQRFDVEMPDDAPAVSSLMPLRAAS